MPANIYATIFTPYTTMILYTYADVQMPPEQSNRFLDGGIGIITVPDFLRAYAGKPIPAPIVPMPRPSELIFLCHASSMLTLSLIT